MQVKKFTLTLILKMNNFIYILFLILLVSCDSEINKKTAISPTEKPKTDSTLVDNSITFLYKIDYKDRNITNNTDRQVDLLFNGVKDFLGGQRNPKVTFRTECMSCEPIQEFMGGLLFAKRLLILNDEIRYYRADFNLEDRIDRIEQISDNRNRVNPEFLFKNGTGSIKYTGVSCNDTDYNKVKLSYATGEIIIDSLINASFFEYDINKDGQKEQYLMGTRNCSQELVLLRIDKQEGTNR